MRTYRKTLLVEVIETFENGDVLVRNKGNHRDTWIIPAIVFEESYEEVEDN